MKTPKNQWPENIIQTVINMHQGGKTTKVISEYVDIPRSTISSWIHENKAGTSYSKEHKERKKAKEVTQHKIIVTPADLIQAIVDENVTSRQRILQLESLVTRWVEFAKAIIKDAENDGKDKSE
jgi:transposase